MIKTIDIFLNKSFHHIITTDMKERLSRASPISLNRPKVCCSMSEVGQKSNFSGKKFANFSDGDVDYDLDITAKKHPRIDRKIFAHRAKIVENYNIVPKKIFFQTLI